MLCSARLTEWSVAVVAVLVGEDIGTFPMAVKLWVAF